MTDQDVNHPMRATNGTPKCSTKKSFCNFFGNNQAGRFCRRALIPNSAGWPGSDGPAPWGRWGVGGGPGHGPIHHPAHLGEPPLGPLHTALPRPSPAPPAGNTQFQLICLIRFDLIYVAHRHFSFRFAHDFTPGGWTKAVQPKKSFPFPSWALNWLRFHAHRVPQTLRRRVPIHQGEWLANWDAGGVWVSRRGLSDWPAGCGFGRAAAVKR